MNSCLKLEVCLLQAFHVHVHVPVTSSPFIHGKPRHANLSYVLFTDQFLSWLSRFFCLISCHLLLCDVKEVAGLFEQARESLCMCVAVPPPTRAYLRTLIHNSDLEHLEKVGIQTYST